ncbi:UDP-glucose/GDP-mannose dehydrogenase family protein [Evansella sp. AB-rgal1]|uniref:UDP-glucose dehydrogenase family protein n=1 Tax=Evansella sp. AB-rgal1 TaxID=3242696 RepID=UPI00359D1640
MNIAVVGTGYVGLVTGVSLSEIGHNVICIDIDERKIEQLKLGISPIYEPGLEKLMTKNMSKNSLTFTTNHHEGFTHADVIYIAVGTPEKEDGSANLTYVEQVALDIARSIEKDTVVVIKSTVPVGTSDHVKKLIEDNLSSGINISMVSNPEFLREGSAIHDAFHGDRIIIGADCVKAASIVEEMNKPFGVPVYKTDIRSAEMIKYASNAFLATKISFINEISNICERVDANIEEVAYGMGLDQRIGSQFLKAGIGYGGSCFPKDTKALIQIAGNVHYDFELLKGVVTVNKKQQMLLLEKLSGIYPSFVGKRIGVLGLAFKPNTDDMREAPSITIIEELVKQGAEVIAYDPIASNNAKKLLEVEIAYADTEMDAIRDMDAVLILTEWDEVKRLELSCFREMKSPIVLDGRNCFSLEEMKEHNIDYYSIGRKAVICSKKTELSQLY